MPAMPTFDIRPLMERARVNTARDLAARCGVNRKAIHNRSRRGLTWAEADDFAIRCGFFPWEVWPAWADADPASWMSPVCPTHHNDHVLELPNMTQLCSICTEPDRIAA